MAKRFTDTDKWRNKWFRSLDADSKLAWIFLLDNCSTAGIWEVDEEQIAIAVKGIDFAATKARFFERDEDQRPRIVEIDNGRKWWIRSFVDFQYVQLNEDVRPHQAPIAELKRYGLWKGYSEGILWVSKAVNSPEGHPGPSKGNRSSPVKFEPPTKDDVVAFWTEKNYVGGENNAVKFFNHFSNCDWRLSGGKGRVMKDWKLAADNWNRNDANFSNGKQNGKQNARTLVPSGFDTQKKSSIR